MINTLWILTQIHIFLNIYFYEMGFSKYYGKYYDILYIVTYYVHFAFLRI